MAILEADGVGKVYETRGVKTAALDSIDLAIEEGDFAALAGPSGSGKTTLLNLLGALDEPSWGEVRIDGQALAALGPAQLSELRLRKLGFVFQAYNLIPVFSAAENIEFVMELQGVPAGERRKRALELLAQVELEGLGDKRPLEMSGGQQQRVAVARALASQPRVILADEPTANLDSKTAIRLLDLMVDLNRNQGTTFLFSSHDPLVLERAKRRVWLRDGVIDRIEEGSTA